MSPSMGQELMTISQTADLLLRGHPARAVDLLSQRFKALEQKARGAHWTVARQLELVSAESTEVQCKGPTIWAEKMGARQRTDLIHRRDERRVTEEEKAKEKERRRISNDATTVTKQRPKVEARSG